MPHNLFKAGHGMHGINSTQLRWSVDSIRAALWVGRAADRALQCGLGGETGFHLHRSLLIISETDCLAFTVADPFLRAETLSIPYIHSVQKRRVRRGGWRQWSDLLLIHKDPGWPFNTQSECMFTGCVQTLVPFSKGNILHYEHQLSKASGFYRWWVEKLDLCDAALITVRENWWRI